MDGLAALYWKRRKDAGWSIDAPLDACFDFDYRQSNPCLAALYAKGKTQQWDPADRIDWSVALDPENPLAYDDRLLPVHGCPSWEKADAARRREIRTHYQAYTLSQILHGEQAALMAAGRLVEVMPDIVAKQFAALQAADEARHVQIFARLISEKLGLAYEVDDSLQTLIRQGMSDRRWDFVVLTTQILIEGIALGALHQLREFSRSPLISSVAAYVMVDEARHVSFGMQALEPYYASLTELELRERAQFAEEGIAALALRLNPHAVWRGLGFGEREISDYISLSIPRVIGRLLVRTGVLLQKLRLRPGTSAQAAGRRLELWHRADERAADL